MSDSNPVDDVFADRPNTVYVDGVGEVPVHYVENEDAPLPPVSPVDVYAPSSEVAWRVLADELVVYHQRLATSHVLDSVSSLLWQCLDGVSTLHEIFVDIADAFGQQLDSIVSDLATVVAEWKRDSLVVVPGEPVALPLGGEPVVPTWRHLVDPPNN